MANASKMKNIILNGYLSGPNFAIFERIVFKPTNRLPARRETSVKLKNSES